MDRFERISQVQEQLNSFIDRTRREYSMSYGEMIGIMDMCKMDLWYESTQENRPDNGSVQI